jgi:hypothetical protein
VQTKFDLARYRGRRIRVRFVTTSIEVSNAVTVQQALSWNPTEADDGWYIDDIQVTNTLVSAASVVVDPADRSGLPACGPVCGSVTASLIATPPTVDADEAVTLDASGSAADQCPGGTLHYRFWMDGDQNVLQEWGPDATATYVPNRTVSYGMDVRCSTHPVCTGRATVVVPLVCQSIDPAPFPEPITWAGHGQMVWTYTPHPVDAIRGDLDALQANKGQFNGTVRLCLLNGIYTDNFVDGTAPNPGQGFYYLVKEVGSPPVCGFNSWRTGSPAEVPGAGGDRDTDIALDPNACP